MNEGNNKGTASLYPLKGLLTYLHSFQSSSIKISLPLLFLYVADGKLFAALYLFLFTLYIINSIKTILT